jgi:gamma-glutamyl hercynylcysteine S-oxide synthase
VLQTLPVSDKRQGLAPLAGPRASAAEEILIPKIRAQIGARGDGFAYDNELPPQIMDIESFCIDRDLTTNAEYAQFIDRGGYELRELWSDDGWAWKQQTAVTAPLGWSLHPYRERTFFSEVPLRDDAPVTGVSWFEAEAYAAFRGRRLPTEFEWEVAASYDPVRGRMRRFVWGDDERGERKALSFSTHPVGSDRDTVSALGLNDACTNLWQWTSSPFVGYPGFRAYPYPEYSQTWFDGDHHVARGGSWFTHPALTRTSFRNFYRRQFRPAFIGIRCARDAR